MRVARGWLLFRGGRSGGDGGLAGDGIIFLQRKEVFDERSASGVGTTS
jgi:hypothetical protein